ncbi:MAG: hypothetical protein E7586_03540 [Ruminococcaceae bacterium]|nr:hypothetical protein [Oscillospiraceae bacterium]
MSKNRKIIYQKYINLLKFDILFALINGMAFAGIASSNDLGMMVILVHFWLFSILIAICHGYVTYTKFKAFFIPHLYFYIAWVASLSPVVFLLDEKNAGYFVDVLELSFIFLLFSCVGALVAKIVMVFKKRSSSSEEEKDAMDENDKNSKISALDFLDSKPSEVIPEREDIIKNNNDSNKIDG